MRKSILILLFGILYAYQLMAASPASGSNTIVFSKTEHNFGELAFKDATYAVVFEFKNEGDQPLKIKKCAATPAMDVAANFSITLNHLPL